ncbi:unnamed protein product, partial [Iphiclides podalirius]
MAADSAVTTSPAVRSFISLRRASKVRSSGARTLPRVGVTGHKNHCPALQGHRDKCVASPPPPSPVARTSGRGGAGLAGKGIFPGEKHASRRPRQGRRGKVVARVDAPPKTLALDRVRSYSY